MLMHDVYNKVFPCNISDLLIPTKDVHHYNTCSSTAGDFYINYSRLNHYKNSFSIMGAKISNSIPDVMRQFPKYRFKKKNNWIPISNLLQTEFLSSYRCVNKWNEKNLNFSFVNTWIKKNLNFPCFYLCAWGFVGLYICVYIYNFSIPPVAACNYCILNSL